MAWRCTGATNAELISNMSKSNIFQSSRVADVDLHPLRFPGYTSSLSDPSKAMSKVDRANYVRYKDAAYEYSPQLVVLQTPQSPLSGPGKHPVDQQEYLP